MPPIPFTIAIPDAAMADLKSRLAQFPKEIAPLVGRAGV